MKIKPIPSHLKLWSDVFWIVDNGRQEDFTVSISEPWEDDERWFVGIKTEVAGVITSSWVEGASSLNAIVMGLFFIGLEQKKVRARFPGKIFHPEEPPLTEVGEFIRLEIL